MINACKNETYKKDAPKAGDGNFFSYQLPPFFSVDKKDAPKAGDGNGNMEMWYAAMCFYKKDAPKAGDGNDKTTHTHTINLILDKKDAPKAGDGNAYLPSASTAIILR